MISVSPLADVAAINVVLSDPWIAPKLAHDGRLPEYIEHPVLTYHGAWIDNRLAGLFIAIRFTAWETEVHAAILKPAIRYSRALGTLFLDQVFTPPDVLRATAYVYSDLRAAANYCRRLGFEDEGRRRNAVVKNGEVLDCLVLGLLRSAWLARRNRLN